MVAPLDEHPPLRAVLDAIPSYVLLIDPERRIVDANRATRDWLGTSPGWEPGQRVGDVFRCVFARDSDEGCGTTDGCPSCVVRRTIREASLGQPAVRRQQHMVVGPSGAATDRWFKVSASAVKLSERDLVLLVLEDISELVVFRGDAGAPLAGGIRPAS